MTRAVHDIVLSKTFDNGMICASEQTVILDEEIAATAQEEFRRLRAHIATPQEKLLLERYLFGGEAKTPGAFNIAAVGRSACWIAREAGFTVPDDTSVILADTPEPGPAEPLTREKLCPVLTVVRTTGRDHALRVAQEVLALDGLGHTATVHTSDPSFAQEYGHAVKAARVVWDAPASHGAIGGLYTSFTPSLSLGCGTSGGNSLSGNISAHHLLTIKRVGRRTRNPQWFRVPPRIYFEPYSLDCLADLPELGRVTLVTSPSARRRGHIERVREALAGRLSPAELDVIDDVGPEPGMDVAQRGAERMRVFGTDTVIALGGGSVMDAAKVMWLLYEHPDLAFTDLREKFYDMRKRVFAFPETGRRARLICVPTTAGSGSEVTPFAVITDPATGLKYPLADYALTPDVAICDPTLTTDLPPHVTADAGFDALTHAIEAYVSVFANDLTDGLCLKAVRLVHDHLESAVREGAANPRAREHLHNAGTIAGMAFGNAFLGVTHAMSHTLGATYRLPHGRTNALLLPHVIRYNGTLPGKLTGWPKYERYQAPERFQDIARFLGLPSATPQDAVTALATAVEDLRERVGIEPSFQAAGIPEEPFLAALPQQAINAYNDQCAPANPRMPMLSEMQALMRDAYYGH
ncbi:iron-containing alcohol dehydrogenase [Streptomyces acidiscabies]|uniref:iron-containing alcohol dehydrogenase n=1 Tax=Streptomyces acidiscabies TaxID=42234 RepID=UPI000A48C6E9|nr:iron-containing alcohol dehydrogenase [Streptomyces acidiscabies]